jgi:DNA polymerase III alpha subunit
MTANVITYRGKSAAREVGKAMGFDPETLGRLSSLVSQWEWKGKNDTLEHSFQHAGFDVKHAHIHKFLELCMRIQDLPRHLGQHSGGMVICQGQLDRVVPLERTSMPGRTVVQWDKEDCADLGIIKVDLLGLGMMAVIQDSLSLVRSITMRPSTWPNCPRIRWSTKPCSTRIRWACSRWRAGRRWHRCRAITRRNFMTWWCRWRSSGRGQLWAR